MCIYLARTICIKYSGVRTVKITGGTRTHASLLYWRGTGAITNVLRVSRGTTVWTIPEATFWLLYAVRSRTKWVVAFPHGIGKRSISPAVVERDRIERSHDASRILQSLDEIGRLIAERTTEIDRPCVRYWSANETWVRSRNPRVRIGRRFVFHAYPPCVPLSLIKRSDVYLATWSNTPDDSKTIRRDSKNMYFGDKSKLRSEIYRGRYTVEYDRYRVIVREPWYRSGRSANKSEYFVSVYGAVLKFNDCFSDKTRPLSYYRMRIARQIRFRIVFALVCTVIYIHKLLRFTYIPDDPT